MAMPLNVISRSSWGAAAPKRSPIPMRAEDVRTVYLHYLGNAPRLPFNPAQLMRDIQRMHLNDPDNDYSDFAYNEAYDPVSRTFFEGRGLNVKDGATRGEGGKSISLLIMNGLGEYGRNAPALTDGNIADINQWLDWVKRSRPNLTAVKGHREAPSNPTGCPGDDTVNLIHSGRIGFNISSQPSEEDELLAAKDDIIGAILKVGEKVNESVGDAKAYTDHVVRYWAEQNRKHTEAVVGEAAVAIAREVVRHLPHATSEMVHVHTEQVVAGVRAALEKSFAAAAAAVQPPA